MRDPHATHRWKAVISPLVRAKNPLCQFFDRFTGKQCAKPSEVVHHLIDWKDKPEFFFAWENLVAVCADHHQGGQRGETQDYVYVHTIGTCGAVYEHNGGFPEWHPEYVPHSEADLILKMATSGGWKK